MWFFIVGDLLEKCFSWDHIIQTKTTFFLLFHNFTEHVPIKKKKSTLITLNLIWIFLSNILFGIMTIQLHKGDVEKTNASAFYSVTKGNTDCHSASRSHIHYLMVSCYVLVLFWLVRILFIRTLSIRALLTLKYTVSV